MSDEKHHLVNMEEVPSSNVEAHSTAFRNADDISITVDDNEASQTPSCNVKTISSTSDGTETSEKPLFTPSDNDKEFTTAPNNNDTPTTTLNNKEASIENTEISSKLEASSYIEDEPSTPEPMEVEDSTRSSSGEEEFQILPDNKELLDAENRKVQEHHQQESQTTKEPSTKNRSLEEQLEDERRNHEETRECLEKEKKERKKLEEEKKELTTKKQSLEQQLKDEQRSLQKTRECLEKEKKEREKLAKEKFKQHELIKELEDDVSDLQRNLRSEEEEHKSNVNNWKRKAQVEMQQKQNLKQDSIQQENAIRELQTRLQREKDERKKNDMMNASIIHELKEKKSQLNDSYEELRSQTDDLEEQLVKDKKKINTLEIEKFHTALLYGDLPTAIEQITMGVDIHARMIKDETGRQALHLAAEMGYSDLVDELLKAGASHSTTDYYGDTPLHKAARNGHQDVVHNLLKKGADPQVQDRQDFNVTHIATAAGHTPVLCEMRQYWFNTKSSSASNSPFEEKTRDGSTLLHIAAANNQQESAQFLLSQNIDRNEKNNHGLTARLYASALGFSKLNIFLAFAHRFLVGNCIWKAVWWRILGLVLSIRDICFVTRWPNKEETEILQLEEGRRPEPPQKLEGEYEDESRERESLKRRKEKIPPKETKSRRHEDRPRQHQFPSGLPNLTNTCYMNSALQCLYHTQPLTNYFNTLHRGSFVKRSSTIVPAYANLIRAMKEGRDQRTAVSNIKTVAGNHDDLFRDFQQKEAHDFISSILQWMHQDLAEEVPDIQSGTERTIKESTISKLFHGVQRSSIKCKKYNYITSENFEPFSNITLAVNKTETCHLEDLLRNHFRPQMLEWSCKMCECDHPCQMQTQIHQLPHILIIHFSRYIESNRYARKAFVTYPEDGLSLDEVMSFPDQSAKYRLYAVCYHNGTMDGGHYTAYCKSKNQWYYLNDSSVTKSDINTVLGLRQAHILFYERM